MRRLIRCCPLMLICLLFVFSLAAVGYVAVLSPSSLGVTETLLVAVGAALAVTGLCAAALRGWGAGRLIPLLLGLALWLGCAVGVMYFVLHRSDVTGRYSGQNRAVEATVERIRYSSASYMIFDARVSSVDGEACSLPVTVRSQGAPGLRVGERFRAAADISETEPYDGSRSSLLYSVSEGRFLTLDISASSVYGRERSDSITARFARLRERVGESLSVRLGDEAGLCRALMLGDRTELGDGISDDFSGLGISHIVAVSGLHLGIITAAVSFVLRRLRLPYGIRITATAVCALMFAALTGFSSSVLRSLLMLLIASLAKLGGRSGHMPTSLSAAVALIVLCRPCAALDAGLVLSFSSTFGIAVIGAPLCRRLGNRISDCVHDVRDRYFSRRPSELRGAAAGLAVGINEFLIDSVIIGASANVFTVPLVYLYFGFSSAYSVPATVLFSPLAGLLLTLSPLALLPGGMFCSAFFAGSVGALSFFIAQLASVCASLAFEMGPLGAAAITAAMLHGLPFVLIGLPALAYRSGRRRRALTALSLVLGAVMLVCGIASAYLLAAAGVGTAPFSV